MEPDIGRCASPGARQALPALILLTALLVGMTSAAALFDSGATADANTLATSTLEPPSGLQVSTTCLNAGGTADSGVASAALSWTMTPSGFATGYRLERWQGGSLESSQTISPTGTTSATDGPLLGGAIYQYRLYAVYEQWTSIVVSRSVTTSCAANGAIALVSRAGETDPVEMAWSDTGLVAKGHTAATGKWRIIVAEHAPSRAEIIAVGVDDNGRITGQIRSAGAWTAMPANVLATVSSSSRWGFDVAYESTSGDAMVVWNNGTTGTEGISWTVWNGTAWSPVDTITTPRAGEPQQMHLASSPTKDEMILIASNAASEDYALVWDGTQWVDSDAIALSDQGDDLTDVNVAYEHQTGEAMVVYGRNSPSLAHRVWNGGWGNEVNLLPPSGSTGKVRWTTVAADPGSDRFAVGVVTFSGEIWVVHWTGTFWQSQLTVSGNASSTVAPVVALGFERQSGDALVTYGETGTNAVSYRTWTPGTAWSGEVNDPNIGAAANTMILRPRPGSDQMMLVLQDNASDVGIAHWDGSLFATAMAFAKSDETTHQPFEWVWLR